MAETVKCVLEEGATLPVRGSKGAACWDIFAAEDAELRPYVAHRMTTGLRAELPPGHVLLLFPRSGFSFNNQVLMPNSVGVGDEDYRGVYSLTAIWMPDPLSVLQIVETRPATPYFSSGHAALRYNPKATFRVKKGDRITQAMLLEYKEQIWEVHNALSATDRGNGGFGSTGLGAIDPS